MLCEIINPSDPYTLRCENFVAAAAAICVLGSGNMGLESQDHKHRTPILFGWDAWLEENGVGNGYVVEHRLEIADILDSVMIGSYADRADAEAMLELIPEDKRSEWLEGRHDRHRSSMNNIGKVCQQWAAKLRAQK